MICMKKMYKEKEILIMEEKRIIVDNIDEFEDEEYSTYEKFLHIASRFMYTHPNEFCDDDSGIKTCLYLHLNKGYDKKKLDALSQELYKELVELLGEATKIEENHEEGFYSRCFEWNYPTYCYYVVWQYVYDGYEEEYYDIFFDEIEQYDEDELEEIYEDEDLNKHRVGCGIEYYEDFEE